MLPRSHLLSLLLLLPQLMLNLMRNSCDLRLLSPASCRRLWALTRVVWALTTRTGCSSEPLLLPSAVS